MTTLYVSEIEWMQVIFCHDLRKADPHGATTLRKVGELCIVAAAADLNTPPAVLELP